MKKAILLVAYGACTQQARRCLAHFEACCRARFLEWPIRWAYTSHILREKLILQKRKSDSVGKALMRLNLEKFTDVAIQPLQTIAGSEHAQTCAQALAIGAQTGMRCAVGHPLLAGRTPLENVAQALIAHMPPERKPEENVIFMGHGARHAAAAMYAELDAAMRGLDARAHVGAMSGANTLAQIAPRLAPGPVWLVPLLSAIGNHALLDMAGPGPDSWRSRIEALGHACRPTLRGMAETDPLCQIWLDHLEEAMARIA